MAGNHGLWRQTGPQQQTGLFPWNRIHGYGTLANRPRASNQTLGWYYQVAGTGLYQVQLVNGKAAWVQVGGVGSVTSVALTVPAEFSVSGSPITGAGTLAISKANESANTFWAGPTSGGAAAPTFRTITTSDVPVFVAAGASHAAGIVPDPGSTSHANPYLIGDNAHWIQIVGVGNAVSYASNVYTITNGFVGVNTQAASYSVLASDINKAIWFNVSGVNTATLYESGTTAAGYFLLNGAGPLNLSAAHAIHGATTQLTSGEWALVVWSGSNSTGSVVMCGFHNPMTTSGNLIIGGASGVALALAPNATATDMFLRCTSSTISWATLTTADMPGTVILSTGAVAFGANQSMGGFRLTSVADPSAAQDAATKNYVDTVATGLSPKPTAKVATTAALASYTYSNGTSGVGATITFTATGTNTIDGYTTALNDHVLVKNETAGNAPYNGLYKVTTAGAGGVAGVWTRDTSMDQSAEFGGGFVMVESGTSNAETMWVCTTDNPTVGTTNVTFAQFNAPTAYTADETTLHLSGTVFSIKSTYVGQTSITTLGTITTGTWHGSTLDVSHGGTGVTSLSAHGILIGGGTGAVNVVNLTLGQQLYGTAGDPTAGGPPDVRKYTINGGFDFFQENGTSSKAYTFAGPAAGDKYICDQFLANNQSGLSGWAASQGAGGPNSSASLVLTQSARSDKVLVYQPLENFVAGDLSKISAQVTFQVRLRMPTGTAVKVNIGILQWAGTADTMALTTSGVFSAWASTSASDPTWTTNFTLAGKQSITATTSFQLLSTTIALSASCTNFLPVLWLDAQTNNVGVLELAEWMLTPTPCALTWTPDDPQIETGRCRRFFQIYAQPTLRGVAVGNTSCSRLGMSLPVPMRVAPSATMSGNLPVYDGVTTNTLNSIAANYSTASMCEVDGATGAAYSAAGRAIVVYQTGTSSLTLDARLK